MATPFAEVAEAHGVACRHALRCRRVAIVTATCEDADEVERDEVVCAPADTYYIMQTQSQIVAYAFCFIHLTGVCPADDWPF